MWIEIIYYLAIGAIAGTLSGLLGIGGGVIVVPLLVLVYTLQNISSSLVMHMAVATSLAAMIVTTGSAVFAHYRHGAKFGSLYRLLAPGIAIGALTGAIVAHKLPTNILQFVFGFFVLLIALHMIASKESLKGSHRLPPASMSYVIAFLIGTISSLLGLGGGTFVIPFLSYCNIKMHNAVGVSAACGLTIAFISSASLMLLGSTHGNLPSGSTGYIYWPAVISIAITSPFFAWFGAAVSYRLPVKRLRQIFAVFLLGVGIYML